ncbi:MAG: c-type cytochrome domain-containing protein [Bacteroidota bacterium]
MNGLIEFIGRFHPVLVHLPIGFLLLALVFQWLSGKEKYAGILPATKIAFLLGMVSALLSCVTGWSLSSGGEYDEDTLSFHKWMGISVAAISIVGYLLVARPNTFLKRTISLITFLLIIITGHLGGTLTHGEGFLTKGISIKSGDSSKLTRKNIANVQEAQVFADIIQPVLHDKCGGCHSATKQKGGLRLDGKEWILKGGKDGQVFLSGNADASELYKRVIMDPLEEKHMPPKGKPQLTEQEVNLLHWWINSNAGFEKKVKEVTQPAQIMPALLAMQSAAVTVKKAAIPDSAVEKISQDVLDTLRKAGIIVLPVAVNSNYLLANFVSIPKPDDTKVGLLRLIKKQLVWLTLSGVSISPASWKTIADCANLTRLHIDHSNITDDGLKSFSTLKHLQYLNLVATQISSQGVQSLKSLPELENVFLGQTSVKTNDFIVLQKMLPKVMLDSGNYHMEFIATDTQVVKASPVKK